MNVNIYIYINVSSTETDINTWLAKARTGIDRLWIIWKSNLIDKTKCSFFRAAVVSILMYGCTTWTLTKRMEKRLDEQRQGDQLEPMYNSFVPIQDIVLKTCRKQWTIEKGGEKGSGISVLMVRHDDYYIYIYIQTSYIYIYIYIYVCVCVCVCIYRERDGEEQISKFLSKLCKNWNNTDTSFSHNLPIEPRLNRIWH